MTKHRNTQEGIANGAVQLIATTPEEIVGQIVDRVRQEFAFLANKFQPKEPEEWMTRQEVAEWFKVDLSTIHRWAEKGILKKYGIGSKVRYRRSEVIDAIQQIKAN